MPRVEKQTEIRNRLLKAFPPKALERLRPALHLVDITKYEVIDNTGRPIQNLYFVNRGLVSMVKRMQDGRTVEIEAVGIEGLTDPSSLFVNDRAILETIVQVPGTAFCIKRDILKREMARDDVLHDLIQRYTRFTFSRFAQTAACNRLHSIEERCSRWLLIAHDSALSDTFPLTHEFLAMMLGVQRTSLSTVASYLRKAGLIEYTRGRITILDRPGLEDVACECYGVIRREMDRVFRRSGRRRASGAR